MDDSSTLFLGDLSVFCTEKDIRKLFRTYGTIEAIRIKRGSSGKANLSYGFIKFAERQSAEQACHELNGVMFLGRGLRYVYIPLFSCIVLVMESLFNSFPELAGLRAKVARNFSMKSIWLHEKLIRHRSMSASYLNRSRCSFLRPLCGVSLGSMGRSWMWHLRSRNSTRYYTPLLTTLCRLDI